MTLPSSALAALTTAVSSVPSSRVGARAADAGQSFDDVLSNHVDARPDRPSGRVDERRTETTAKDEPAPKTQDTQDVSADPAGEDQVEADAAAQVAPAAPTPSTAVSALAALLVTASAAAPSVADPVADAKAPVQPVEPAPAVTGSHGQLPSQVGAEQAPVQVPASASADAAPAAGEPSVSLAEAPDTTGEVPTTEGAEAKNASPAPTAGERPDVHGSERSREEVTALASRGTQDAKATPAAPAPAAADSGVTNAAPATATDPSVSASAAAQSVRVTAATPVVAAAPVAAPAAVATPPTLSEQLGVAISPLRAAGPGEHVLVVRVDPEHFGPVRVVAHIGQDGTRLQLLGGTEQAREALKAALPDLRRDLAAAGLEANIDLSSGSRQGSQAFSAPGRSFASRAASPERRDLGSPEVRAQAAAVVGGAKGVGLDVLV